MLLVASISHRTHSVPHSGRPGANWAGRRWAQSLSSQITAPEATTAPVSAFRPVTVPAL